MAKSATTKTPSWEDMNVRQAVARLMVRLQREEEPKAFKIKSNAAKNYILSDDQLCETPLPQLTSAMIDAWQHRALESDAARTAMQRKGSNNTTVPRAIAMARNVLAIALRALDGFDAPAVKDALAQAKATRSGDEPDWEKLTAPDFEDDVATDNYAA